MIDLAVLSAPAPSQPSSSSDDEDDCEGSEAESTARSISRDDLLGLPKWTAEDSGGETIRASREANFTRLESTCSLSDLEQRHRLGLSHSRGEHVISQRYERDSPGLRLSAFRLADPILYASTVQDLQGSTHGPNVTVPALIPLLQVLQPQIPPWVTHPDHWLKAFGESRPTSSLNREAYCVLSVTTLLYCNLH